MRSVQIDRVQARQGDHGWEVRVSMRFDTEERAKAFAQALADLELDLRRKAHNARAPAGEPGEPPQPTHAVQHGAPDLPTVRAVVEYAVATVGRECAVEWCLEHAQDFPALSRVPSQRRRGRLERVLGLLGVPA